MMVNEGGALPACETMAREVARRAGVGLEGVTIRVIEDPDYQAYMRHIGAVAVTPSDLETEIHLMPEAFASVEDLARTLGHERNHVAQLGLYGPPGSTRVHQTPGHWGAGRKRASSSRISMSGISEGSWRDIYLVSDVRHSEERASTACSRDYLYHT